MRKLNQTIFVTLSLCTIVLALASSANGFEPPKKILMFSSEDVRLPGLLMTEEAIRSTLNKGGEDRFTFYNEAQDNARIPNGKYEREYIDYLRRKYDGEKIDLIFVRSPPSIRFLLKHEAEIFT